MAKRINKESQQDRESTAVERLLGCFFYDYLTAITEQNIAALFACYTLPCTLSSPEKLVLLTNEETFNAEFTDIFKLLTNANVSAIKLLNTCYQAINEHCYLVNINWQFLAEHQQIFSEFCAVYHLSVVNQQVKIINVISQDVTQQLLLPNQLTIREDK